MMRIKIFCRRDQIALIFGFITIVWPRRRMGQGIFPRSGIDGMLEIKRAAPTGGPFAARHSASGRTRRPFT